MDIYIVKHTWYSSYVPLPHLPIQELQPLPESVVGFDACQTGVSGIPESGVSKSLVSSQKPSLSGSKITSPWFSSGVKSSKDRSGAQYFWSEN